jgi:4-hydroxy-tetrahydrodipicolinate synthase
MFSGSLVAIVTPMRPDGRVDFEAWARLVDFHLENGTSGIVVGGSTGESATLTESELRELSESAARQVRGRMPIIVGAGTSSTAATVERVRWLSELAIDGLLIVTPAYNRPTQEGLYRHFAAAAEAARKPIILYNVPSRTAVDLKPETVGRLSQLPGIVALKESVTEAGRTRALVEACRKDFCILSGEDAVALRLIREGTRGVISVTANVAPRGVANVMAAGLRGDFAAAETLDASLAGLHRELFIESNPIPTKWALARMGLMGEGIRLPLTPLSPGAQPAVLAALRAAGVAV